MTRGSRFMRRRSNRMVACGGGRCVMMFPLQLRDGKMPLIAMFVQSARNGGIIWTGTLLPVSELVTPTLVIDTPLRLTGVPPVGR